MKRLLKITAVVLAAGMTVAFAGCSGCGGKSKNLTVTNSNWYTGTSFSGIQPSFIVGENEDYTPEVIEYSVSFDSSNATNSSYSVAYDKGKFVTEFYATKYDWNGENIPAGYKMQSTETVYCYKTSLTISVKYALKGGASSEEFKDSASTECYFRSASDNLQPIYSKQVLKTTSPAVRKAKKLEDAYKSVDAVYENFYNKNCTEITSIYTEAGKQPATKIYGGLNKVKTSLFDNSSLYVALRSMKLYSNFPQTPISMFSAAEGGISSYTLYASAAALGETERKEISAALQEKELYTVKSYTDENGNVITDNGITYNAVNVAYSGGKLAGTAQTVWYAAVQNDDNNTARATMLKIRVPLSFGLGTLNYTLSKVHNTLWNY